jgi:hypothetical protein
MAPTNNPKGKSGGCGAFKSASSPIGKNVSGEAFEVLRMMSASNPTPIVSPKKGGGGADSKPPVGVIPLLATAAVFAAFASAKLKGKAPVPASVFEPYEPIQVGLVLRESYFMQPYLSSRVEKPLNNHPVLPRGFRMLQREAFIADLQVR